MRFSWKFDTVFFFLSFALVRMSNPLIGVRVTFRKSLTFRVNNGGVFSYQSGYSSVQQFQILGECKDKCDKMFGKHLLFDLTLAFGSKKISNCDSIKELLTKSFDKCVVIQIINISLCIPRINKELILFATSLLRILKASWTHIHLF